MLTRAASPLGTRSRPTASDVAAARGREQARKRKAAALKRKLDRLIAAAEAAIVPGHVHLDWFDLHVGPDSPLGQALWPDDGSFGDTLGHCTGDDGDLYRRKADLVVARSFAAATPGDPDRAADAERQERRVESWARYLPYAGEPVG